MIVGKMKKALLSQELFLTGSFPERDRCICFPVLSSKCTVILNEDGIMNLLCTS